MDIDTIVAVTQKRINKSVVLHQRKRTENIGKQIAHSGKWLEKTYYSVRSSE